jgi:arabinose-5-phosphate isomerase
VEQHLDTSEVIERLLDKEKESLLHFFDTVDKKSIDHVARILLDCRGLILLTGVGKSGLVAEKISVTLTSTGSRAFYISPINALHGDIGIASAQDVMIMISKSGESEELLHLVPFLRNKGAKILSIVSNPHSRLAKASDYSLVIPLERELCPFDLAPTTSTVLQMIIGDILAISLMELKQITQDQYAMNHPAGRIGRRIVTKVKDLMLKGEAIPTSHPADILVDTLVELSNKRCGCVLIIDAERKLKGIFTDGDLRRTLQNKGAAALNSKLESVMIRTPRWINDTDLAWTALQKMEEDQKHPIMVLPVLDDEHRVVGIIKMHDIVQAGI